MMKNAICTIPVKSTIIIDTSAFLVNEISLKKSDFSRYTISAVLQVDSIALRNLLH